MLWLIRPRDVSAGEIIRVVPDVLRLARILIADPASPTGVRVALVIMLVWLISPIDLVPEFIPVLGPVDDVIVTSWCCATSADASGTRRCSAAGPARPTASGS